MANIVGGVSIQGHRIIGGVCVPVSKILKIMDTECPDCLDVYCYSDGGTDLLPSPWYEGECKDPQYDFEAVTLTDNGGVTTIPGVARREIFNGTPIQKLYDKDGNDVTLTHEIWKTGEEKYDLSEKYWFCVGGNTVSRTDIFDVSGAVPVVVGSFWQNIDGTVVPPPTPGTAQPGICSTQPFIIGSQTINIGGTPTALTPPTGSFSAFISVNSGYLFYTVDNSVPTPINGHHAGYPQYITLDIKHEVDQFLAIGNPTAQIYVTYYDKPFFGGQG